MHVTALNFLSLLIICLIHVGSNANTVDIFFCKMIELDKQMPDKQMAVNNPWSWEQDSVLFSSFDIIIKNCYIFYNYLKKQKQQQGISQK